MGVNAALLVGHPANEARAAPRPRFTPYEDAIVAQMRARSAGWAAVAKAIGHPTHDVRLRYDPDYDPPPAPARPFVTATAEPVQARVGRRVKRDRNCITIRPGTIEARCLALIADGFSSTPALRDKLGRDEHAVNNVVGSLIRKGLIVSTLIGQRASRRELTGAGRRSLEALRG